MVVNAAGDTISDEGCGEEHPALCQIDCRIQISEF